MTPNSTRTGFFGLKTVLALAALAAPLGVATHDDGDYEIPLFFEWGDDHLELETILVPPGHGQITNNDGLFGGDLESDWDACTGTYTQAMLDSIENWRVAIAAFGSSFLAGNLTIVTWTLGCDPNEDMPASPEIVVYTDESKGPVLGFAATNMPDTPHCIVNNGKFHTNLKSWNYEDMFNVMGQEFGHCLGLGHTGDVSGAPAGAASHPGHDTMEGRYEHSIGAAGTHRHCVSNLNVLALESVFDSVSDPGEIIEMLVGDYALATNPLCNSVLLPDGS